MQQQRIGSASISSLAISGFCLIALALGLVRFAYTPLLPALVQQHWMNHVQAGYLGATNFTGYLIGALTAKTIGKYFRPSVVIKLCTLLSAVSFFACSWHLGLVWLNAWRGLAGITSAIVMVLTPTTILHCCPNHVKARVSGIMFCGIGIMVIVSGIGVPHFVHVSVSFAWIVLGMMAAVLAFFGWYFLPEGPVLKAQPCDTESQHTFHLSLPFVLLLVAYFFYGIGGVPHSLFIVQYIANFLHFGNYVGGLAWICYGVGVIITPLTAGLLADRFGACKCLTAIYLIATVALAMPLMSDHLSVLYLSALLAGGVSLTAVSLSASRLSELMQGNQYATWWGVATSGFALTQSGAAFVMSALLAVAHGYMWIFSIGAAAFLLSFLCMLTNLLYWRLKSS